MILRDIIVLRIDYYFIILLYLFYTSVINELNLCYKEKFLKNMQIISMNRKEWNYNIDLYCCLRYNSAKCNKYNQ